MSAENQPSENLPFYLPYGWQSTDADYVTYPVAQSSNILFPVSIATNTINATAVSSAITLGNNVTSGTITIGNATPTTGTTGIVSIGGAGDAVTQVNGTLKTNTINSIASNMAIEVPTLNTMTIASTDEVQVRIGEGKRSGTTSTGVTSYVVHRYSEVTDAKIGNDVSLNNGKSNHSSTFIQTRAGMSGNLSDGNVEIKTGLFNTGEIRIGQFTSDTNKTTTVIKGDLRANKIDANLASPPSSTVLSIGSNMLGGSVEIFTGDNQKGSINVGQWTSDAPINKTSTNIKGDVSIADTGGSISIGNATDTNTTTIFNTLKANTHNAAANSSDMTIGSNLTTGTIAIGSALDGSTTSNGLITIGSSTASSVTTTAKQIKQTVPVLGGTVSQIFGNADNTTSISTTCSRKETATLGALSCFTLTVPDSYCAGYFEIHIGGTNFFYAGYAFKGCFSIDANAIDDVTVSSVSTLFAARGRIPAITFTRVGTLITLEIDTSTGNGSTNQNFIATLMAFPTVISPTTPLPIPLFDFAVAAI